MASPPLSLGALMGSDVQNAQWHLKFRTRGESQTKENTATSHIRITITTGISIDISSTHT